jgi:hypothetical protein
MSSIYLVKAESDAVDACVAKNISSDKSRISDDLLFHNIVGRTASKARDALRNVDLDEYDNASLVISVEGEYKDPVKGENSLFLISALNDLMSSIYLVKAESDAVDAYVAGPDSIGPFKVS